MGSSLVKIDVHVVFHVKRRRVVMRDEDLPRIFQYFGGIIRSIDAIPIMARWLWSILGQSDIVGHDSTIYPESETTSRKTFIRG